MPATAREATHREIWSAPEIEEAAIAWDASAEWFEGARRHAKTSAESGIVRPGSDVGVDGDWEPARVVGPRHARSGALSPLIAAVKAYNSSGTD
jgi:hypothetical protein